MSARKIIVIMSYVESILKCQRKRSRGLESCDVCLGRLDTMSIILRSRI